MNLSMVLPLAPQTAARCMSVLFWLGGAHPGGNPVVVHPEIRITNISAIPF
jgi:hypothetical protein